MKLMLPDKSVIELSVQGRSIETILSNQGIDPLTTLISREDEIIPEDTIPDDEDVIRVIRRPWRITRYSVKVRQLAVYLDREQGIHLCRTI